MALFTPPCPAAVALGLLLVIPAPGSAQQVEGAGFRTTLSSGAFALPTDAVSLDWVILNNAPDTQTVQVTVWRLTMDGPKAKLAPGTLTLKVAPGGSAHNANPVGGGGPYQIGYYFEVIVAANDRRVLPTVAVWSDRAARTIPGTRIGPRDFVDLRQ
jgi:hypothetical protein